MKPQKKYLVMVHLHPEGDERTSIERDAGECNMYGFAYELIRAYRAPPGECVDGFTILNRKTGHRAPVKRGMDAEADNV